MSSWSNLRDQRARQNVQYLSKHAPETTDIRDGFPAPRGKAGARRHKFSGCRPSACTVGRSSLRIDLRRFRRRWTLFQARTRLARLLEECRGFGRAAAHEMDSARWHQRRSPPVSRTEAASTWSADGLRL